MVGALALQIRSKISCIDAETKNGIIPALKIGIYETEIYCYSM